MDINPFVLNPYEKKELFCDRENEVEKLVKMVENRENITLISPRRYGKTGLIYRLFDELKDRKSEVETYYVDVFSTRNLAEFVTRLTEAMVGVLRKESLIKRFFTSLGGIRPLLSYDPLSGSPQVAITWQSHQEKQMTLKAILEYLERGGRPVVLAIDEFQQVREFEDCNMEALLRTYVQPLHNVRFIFCGSKKHVMLEMFADARRPFYESTTLFFLDKISLEAYSEFVGRQFALRGRSISDEAVEWIMEWTRRHTYYTQYLCNKIFATGKKEVGLKDAYAVAGEVLKGMEMSFIELKSLLTAGQWNYLRAVAKEGVLRQPTASVFLTRYGIATAAGSKRILAALMDKELILSTTTMDGVEYCVYNVFLSRWMERR